MMALIKEWIKEIKSVTRYKNSLTASSTVCLLLLFIHYHMGHLAIKMLPYAPGLYLPIYFTACGLSLFLLPLITTPFIKNNDAFGLKIGNWKVWRTDLFAGSVIIITIVIIFGRLEYFSAIYPLFKRAKESWKIFLLYECAHFIYLSGWEFLFRGYMLFSLRNETGDSIAIIIQMIPFVILHAGKPELESFVSIISGIILGIMAIRGKSVFPCMLLHFVAALSMDLLAMS